MNREQLAGYAINDVEEMLMKPFPWAQRWLAEFRDDKNDNFMVAPFADRCLLHQLRTFDCRKDCW
jgi:hypothetical protein